MEERGRIKGLVHIINSLTSLLFKPFVSLSPCSAFLGSYRWSSLVILLVFRILYINPLSVSLLPKYYRSNRNSVQEWGPIIAWRAHRSFSPEGLVWAEPRHPLISRGLNCLMTGVFITSPIVAVTTIAMIPMAATLSGGLSISGTSPIASTVR